jgi:uncharacterized RDD family membrane protein YckC
MSDTTPPPPKSGPLNTANSKPADNPLNAVFSDTGPMPPARIGIRALAFLLDFILISAVATVLIWKILLPQSHPGAFPEFLEWGEQLLEWVASEQPDRSTPPAPSHNLAEALNYASDLQLLIFWLYFALGEAFFAGSVGKVACRLRTVSTVTLAPPPFITGVIRGGLKTAVLFLIPPLGLLVALAALWFNRRRQMGHDLLARTVVVDERHLQAIPVKNL